MTHYALRSTLLGGLLLFVVLAMAGCGSSQPDIDTSQGTTVAPTLSSIFGQQPTMLPAPTREPTYVSLVPTPNATAIAQATIAALDTEQLREVIIYDDDLSPDWSLDQSFQTTIDLKSRGFIYRGRYAISAQPLATTGILYFTLNQAATNTFRRSQVQAVRFYLSGGIEPIDNEGMVVTVVGSNIYPYWVENDTSVQLEGRVTDNEPIFSETRLSFLGIQTAIPRRTYAEVTVWLDSLLYDPTYTYVTGLYLKTDKESIPTFYVDQVSLLLTPVTR
jgi:hypothetical protein